jgi:hypothetical protein
MSNLDDSTTSEAHGNSPDIPIDMILEPAMVKTGGGEYVAVPSSANCVWLVRPGSTEEPSNVPWPEGKWDVTSLAPDSPVLLVAKAVIEHKEASIRARYEKRVEEAKQSAECADAHRANFPDFVLPPPETDQKTCVIRSGIDFDPGGEEGVVEAFAQLFDATDLELDDPIDVAVSRQGRLDQKRVHHLRKQRRVPQLQQDQRGYWGYHR